MTATPRHVAGALTLAAALVVGVAACATSSADDAGATPSASRTAEATEAAEPSPSPSPTTDPVADAAAAQQAALEALVAEAQPSIPTFYESFPGMYSQITITAEGANTLVYGYVYSPEAVAGTSLPEMQQTLSGMGATLQATCDSQLFPVMTAAGVTTDPRIRYAYAAPTGEEVWSYTCVPTA